MPPYSRSEIISGSFVLLALAVFTLYAFNVIPINFSFGEPDPARFVARFDDAATLAPGDKVIFAGKDVGRVLSIDIDQAANDQTPGLLQQLIAVRFTITDPTLRLDADKATVAIGKDGLLGRNFIDLNPGPISDRMTPILELAGGGEEITLPAESGRHFGAVISKLGPTLGKLTAILTRIEDGILTDTNLQQIERTLANVEQATGEARAFLDAESDNGARALLVQPARDLLLRADTTLADVHKRLTERTLVEAERLMIDARETSTRTREAIDQIDRNLAEQWPTIEQSLTRLNTALETLDAQTKQVGEDASAVLELSQTMLAENRPEIAEAVRRLRRSTEQAELALRKVRANPARLIFGQVEPLYDADESDDAWLIRSGRSQPYEQRDE